jgi:branched-chain amino acid transport system permease protein
MNWGSILDNTLQGMFGINAVLYALLAIGINVQFGYAGLLNFGQVGFMAVGAYDTAIFASTSTNSGPGLNLWLSIALGLAATLVLALMLGLPTLRLRADYLAIVTIAAGEIIRQVINTPELRDWTAGADGITGYNSPFTALNPFEPSELYGFGPLQFRGNELWSILVGWVVVVLVGCLVYLAMRSPWGRVLKAIREDEDAARALGKNAYWYKVQALMLGGFIGGLAGVMSALNFGSAKPNDFLPNITFLAYAALILGGVARVWGPVVGSMMLWALMAFLGTFMRQVANEGYLPEWLLETADTGPVRFMVVGLGLALLMAFRPQGVFGDRNEMMLEDR